MPMRSPMVTKSGCCRIGTGGDEGECPFDSAGPGHIPPNSLRRPGGFTDSYKTPAGGGLVWFNVSSEFLNPKCLGNSSLFRSSYPCTILPICFIACYTSRLLIQSRSSKFWEPLDKKNQHV